MFNKIKCKVKNLWNSIVPSFKRVRAKNVIMLTIAGIINGFGISVGTFVMIYNILLYIICGFVIKN